MTKTLSHKASMGKVSSRVYFLAKKKQKNHVFLIGFLQRRAFLRNEDLFIVVQGIIVRRNMLCRFNSVAQVVFPTSVILFLTF